MRCIKPNEEKHAFKWDPPKIVQQLRACGVLETIRISAAGFPSRWPYDNFYARYQLLGRQQTADSSGAADWEVAAQCERIVRQWIQDEDKYRFGNSQIFFRAGQVAYLEQVRTETRRRHIISVQSLVRRYLCRRRYLLLRRTAIGLQSRVRGVLARRRTQKLRQNRAAITLQRYVRGWLQRERYTSIRRSIIGLQVHARGLMARRRYAHALDTAYAITLQRYARGYLARQRFDDHKRRVIVCQAAIRRFLARRLYKRMKAEARSITHMQMMYKGLENKIISLQQRIDELNKDRTQLHKQNAEIPDLRQRVDGMRALEAELKATRAQLAEKLQALELLGKQLDTERDEKMSVLLEHDRAKKEWTEQQLIWRNQNDELRSKVGSLMEERSNYTAEDDRTSGPDVATSASVQRASKISDGDANEIRLAYRRALKEKEAVELENAALRQEMTRLPRLAIGTGHSRSISNASSINNDEDGGYGSAKNTLELKRNAAQQLLPSNISGSSNSTQPNSSIVGGGTSSHNASDNLSETFNKQSK